MESLSRVAILKIHGIQEPHRPVKTGSVTALVWGGALDYIKF